VPKVEVFEEIDWSPKPTLRPGMDFHAGTTYFTVPLTRNLVKTVGKGEKARDEAYRELQTYTVTSTHEGFWYDEPSLLIEGFVPSEQVYQERNPRWSKDSTRGYIAGDVASPTSADLFASVRAAYTTYVDYADEMFHDLMALYIMYTYVFRLFDSTGYIHFNGTAASGKSRNLALLDALAFNTVWASSMSAASLYRKLAGSPGTTCIDESEGFDGERGEELRRILNAGYRDGATVIRTEKGPNDRYVPIEYEVFGPKALASINPLEPVIASRCIVVAMRPAIRELPDFEQDDQRWQDLRDSLYVWALDNAASIDVLRASWRTDKKERLAPRLIGRQWETSRQFIILADYIGGEPLAEQVITFFNEYFKKQQAALDATDRLRTTLRALPRVLATKAAHPGNQYGIKDIHEVIASYLEEDAREYFKTKHVGKNLDTIGFREKKRDRGGLRIVLNEDTIRNELRQRRVEPFPEDTDWLEGKVSYQNVTAPPADTEWWEDKEEE
jgi:hypothetical protein